ncbi:MAG: chemotaxis protein CheW [Desulfamplus sp.]|nr:chemotaxis protein CheW [Desulfamplus sp.]
MSYSLKKSDALAGKYTHIIISGEEYGIPTSQVKSVVEKPSVRKVPKAPDFIEGVANINGRIIPLLNPVKRLSLLSPGEIDATRNLTNALSAPSKEQMLLVQLGNVLYGIVVDSVTDISNISSDIIEPMNPLMVKNESPFIAGMAKLPSGIVYLMDLEAVIMSGMPVEKEDQTLYESFSKTLNDFLKPKRGKISSKHLAFMIGEETFGIAANILKGVSRPVDMTCVSSGIISSGIDYIHGLMNRSDRMLPVIDIAKKLEIPSVEYSKESRVIWIDSNGFEFGILVHQVVDFTHIMQSQIKSSLRMIAKESDSHIKGIAMLDQGKRLVTILDVDNLLVDSELAELKKLDEVQMEPSQMKSGKKTERKTTDLLIFTVSDFELAIPTNEVSEVLFVQDLKKIPKVPLFIKGVMPVKGELIPIMDIHRRLELPLSAATTKKRVIIVKKENINYGILVDTVSGIIKVDQNDIVPPHDIIQHIDSRFINGIASVKNTDRSPVVINVDELIKN